MAAPAVKASQFASHLKGVRQTGCLEVALQDFPMEVKPITPPESPNSNDGIIKSYSKYSVLHQDGKEQYPLGYRAPQLLASRPAQFFCDEPRSNNLPNNMTLFEFKLQPQIYAAIQHFCGLYELPELTILLCAFRVAHYRLTSAEDALIGISTDGTCGEEFESGVEFMGNLQCNRTLIDGESFEQIAHQVQRELLSCEGSQTLALKNNAGQIEEDKGSFTPPLIPVLFGLHYTKEEELPEHGTRTSSLFDVEFHLFRGRDNICGRIHFCTQMYTVETISSMASVFQSVIKCGIAQPNISVTSLPLLSDADYAILNTVALDKNENTGYPREASVVDVFRQQVDAFPFRTAVKDATTELSYAELDERSDFVAAWLTKRSLPAETMVGVLADRTCETIIIFLAILKANLAYLPFDVKSPISRVETILSSIPGPKMVLLGLTTEPPRLKLEDVEFLSFGDIFHSTPDASEDAQTTMRPNPPSATSLAYVMFTSGSTGTPKGVMVEHRGIVRLAKENNLTQYLPNHFKMAHLSNIAFDAATWEIYASILNGGTIVCIDTPTVLDYDALSNLFALEEIQTAFLTTALFRQYTQDCPGIISQLEMLCTGGERMNPRDAKAALKIMSGALIHVYGPTENTTFSTLYCISKHETYPNEIPIGQAISNSGAYVMDPKQRLVPLGVTGELVVTGDGLARGYTDPKRNIDRFVFVTVGDQVMRAYRTGDLVRQRPKDGQLEYLSRMDGQVKIRGNRVELGEIEQTLRNHSYVRDAAVIFHQDDGEQELLAFVTIQTEFESLGESPEANYGTDVFRVLQDSPSSDLQSTGVRYDLQQQLRGMLATSLPSYMVPNIIEVLEHIPVNANGKVDRSALVRMVPKRTKSQVSIRQPATESERCMHNIWSKVLNLKENSFGLDASFLDLGGNSLNAMKIVGAARKVGFELTLQDVFRAKTLGDLALQRISHYSQSNTLPENINLIDSATKTTVLEEINSLNIGVGSASIAEVYPLLGLQSRYYQQTTSWREFLDYLYLDLEVNDINPSSFETNCTLTIERYSILRTCFVTAMGKHWQLVLHKLNSPICIKDIDEEQEIHESYRQLMLEDLQQVSEHDPPFRIFLLRQGTKGSRLVVRIQHSQFDAVALQIIFQSLLFGPSSSSPTFFQYMFYLFQQRPKAISFWKELLQGASVTEILPRFRPQVSPEDEKQRPLTAHAQVKIAALPDKSIMLSTLMHAAWAVFLARATGKEDVVYWQFVNGRNSALEGVEEVVGACLSAVPVRVPFPSFTSPINLLRFLQDQLLAPGEADSLGLDIIKECTDWSPGPFDSVFQYLNPSLDCRGVKNQIKLDMNPYLEYRNLIVEGYYRAGSLHVDLAATTSLLTSDEADAVVKDICRIAAELAERFDQPLKDWMNNLQLTI